MKRFLLSERFFGILITLFVAGSLLTRGSLLETVELKFYDLRAKFLQDTTQKPNEVAIVAIDDNSLAQLGRWPWPRSRIAAMVDKLSSYNPKVIGLNIIFSEAVRNPGMAALDDLAKDYQALVNAKAVVERGATSPVLAEIEHAKQKLDEDATLAASLTGKKVVLPVFFEFGPTLGATPAPLPPEVARSAMTLVPNPMGAQNDVTSQKVSFPLARFSSVAAGLGHTNFWPDIRDGLVRRLPLAVTYGDILYPAYALELLRVSLDLDSKDLQIMPASEVTLGKIQAPLDQDGFLNITYRGPENTFPAYSFLDVLNDKVNSEVFKDRIVLLGITAVAQAPRFVTPAGANFSDTELTANVIDDLLHKKFLKRPAWAGFAELVLTLLIGVFVSFLLPRLKAGMGAVVSAALLVILLGAGTWLFVSQNQWLKVTYPAVLLAAGYTGIVSKHFLTTEKRKELTEASQIETSKMLGLSFQGQGMLDLAFEKFRACPLDETLADLLYNLALDFERQRQYNKAVSVYEYIATKFTNYRDIDSKLETLRDAAGGASFGGGRTTDATIMTEGAGMQPTLGPYQVEKELCRGAMGIVYLGNDPMINRQVAIKTIMLEMEGTPEQVKELKMRFFREAESAGHLDHPNIVRIFDAGEEAEIGYIAMELLEGHDLKRYCFKPALLPLPTVLDHCAKVADGLDYAHRAGMIHRDIKPSNIMLLKDGTLRITDFGIARLAASSKTATGTVMGTPSYMSPEQVSGKKVDGRADLWSLGVMLYELATGVKPFKGGDSIGTLLFQIANDAPVSPTAYRPDLPPDVVVIIDKCLKKNPDDRYQQGAEIAADLRQVIERLRTGGSPPAPPEGDSFAKAAVAMSGSGKTLFSDPPARKPSEGTARIDPSRQS